MWGGGHVNVPCTSYVICCYAAGISGVLLRCIHEGVGWGGVGGVMLTFLVLHTLYVATLQRSLVLLLRCIHEGVGWGGGGHVNVPCTSYVICCYATEISGVEATVYTRKGGVGFKEQRSSLVCEMLAMAICESTYSAPAKNNFNAKASGLKRQ